jgi:hypothetical protein
MVDKPLTWAEIDLSAYAHNIKELRRIRGIAKRRTMAGCCQNQRGR